MRITELLDKRSIRIDGAPKSKNEALDQMVELMAKSGKINDLEAYRQEVYRREEEGTTGVGEGIAIPHGKGAFVDKPGLAAMVVKDGVDYDSLDGEPVHLIFLIAAPNTKDNVHLDVLSKLSVLLMDEDFSRALQNAKSPEEFMKIVDEADQEAPDLDEKLKADEATSEDQFRILAVTACPTGIAHTYMAAEGLEKAAKAKGCFIKVETRGSGGAKNVLTAEEIKNADCIIVAADTKVPMDRFNGKKLIEVQVSDGISKADKLIEQAMSGNVPVYTASENAEVSEKKAGGSKGHQIYMQLMKWCFTHAAIRRRRRYFDRSCIPDRWTLCRYDIIDSRSTTEFRFDHTGGGNTEIHRKSCIWIYASGSGRIYCYEHCRQTWSGSRICGWCNCSKRQVWFPRCISSRFSGRLSYPSLKKIVRKTSGSTGKNCSSPSLSGIRHSDRGTCYDVCRRASNRSIEHGTEHSSYKHEWFQ